MRRLPLFTLLAAATTILSGQSLSVYSGNGQVVFEQFLTTIPMTVLATDAKGNPAAGIPITWAVTQGQGTLVRPDAQTDSNGFAGATFLGTAVPFGLSYTQATVTAHSQTGSSATFFVTTAIIRLQGGGSGAPPLVELINPISTNLVITGAVNAILPGAVKVRVSIASGPQAGTLLPNIGVDMHFYNDDEPLPAPFATCRGGTVLTDSTGVAVCDLILNSHIGQVQLSADAGEVQKTRPFLLTITPGNPCTYSISPQGQSFNATGGTGTIGLATNSGCNWAAASNANWVVLSGPVAGSSSASIGYAVATNSGPSRAATITVGSQVFNITQAAAGTVGSPLTISTTSPLPAGATGTAYSYAVQASGGTPPYTWTATGLPPGLSLNSTSGVISGTPQAIGSYVVALTVTDNARASITQSYNLAVSSTPINPNGPVITNSGFPSGAVGQPYKQAVAFTTSCTSPFGAGPTIALSSGSLPPGLTVNSPVDKNWVISGTPISGGSYGFALTITEVCGRSSSASFLLAISGSGTGGGNAGAITAAPQTVSFTAGAGSSTNPGPVIVSLSSSNGATLSYTASIVNQTGGAWLSITNGSSGTTPGSLTLAASNFSNFAAGTYTAQLALVTGGNATVFVPVTLTVSNTAPISVTPSALVFTSATLQAPSFLQQTIQLSASSTTHFTVNFSTDSQNNWLGATPGAADTPSSITAVVNPVGLRPGTYTGRLTLTPNNGVPVTVPISLIVTAPPVLSWSVPSVDNSYITDGPATAPVTVNLASSGSNLQFQLSAPQVSWLSVTPVLGQTPANITLRFDPTGLDPGVYAAQIAASSVGIAGQPVTLQVTFSIRQSAPTISAILHGASFLPTTLAPGLEVQIVGSSLGPLTQADSQPDPVTGLYPTSLAGASVLFNDYEAPVLHASDQQITVLVPYEIAGQSSVNVIAIYRFTQSVPKVFAAADSSPGIFTSAGGQGIIFNEDGSYNGPSAGASVGSVISILGSGEGQTNPPGVDGLLMQSGALAAPVLPVTAQIGGLNANVISATSAPGQPAGVFLIQVQVPDGVQPGSVVPVYVTIGSAPSQDGVTMVIAQ